MAKVKIKTRADWAKEYEEKYAHIPIDLEGRINHILKENKLNKRFIAKVIANRDHIMDTFSMSTYETTLYEVPVTSHRHRSGKFKKHNYVPNAKANNTFFSKKLLEEFLDEIKAICRPTKIDVLCYFPMPSGMPDDEKVLAELGLIRPILTPDWDNSGKAYGDMLSGNFFTDDDLVFEGRVAKYYSSKPRVVIKASVQDKIHSKYILNKIKKSKRYQDMISEGRVEDINNFFDKIN